MYQISDQLKVGYNRGKAGPEGRLQHGVVAQPARACGRRVVPWIACERLAIRSV